MHIGAHLFGYVCFRSNRCRCVAYTVSVSSVQGERSPRDVTTTSPMRTNQLTTTVTDLNSLETGPVFCKSEAGVSALFIDFFRTNGFRL